MCFIGSLILSRRDAGFACGVEKQHSRISAIFLSHPYLYSSCGGLIALGEAPLPAARAFGARLVPAHRSYLRCQARHSPFAKSGQAALCQFLSSRAPLFLGRPS